MASLDSFSSRIVNDVRELVAAPAMDPVPQVVAPKRHVWPWAAALVAVSAIAVTCAVLWTLSREELAKSRAENAAQAAANAEVQRSSRELATTVKDLTAALAASAAQTAGATPASAVLPVGKCDLIGNPYEESLPQQQRQSLAFANLLAGVRQRSGGTISVVIENVGSSRPASPYPPRTEALTAGEWNRAATSNNRVEFTAEPSSP